MVPFPSIRVCLIIVYFAVLALLPQLPVSSLEEKEEDLSNIIPPKNLTDPGFIIAESDSGLSNRLRTLVAYHYIADWKYNKAHLVYIWDVNDACPGHFLELFEPIENVVFIQNSSRCAFEMHAKVIYNINNAVLHWTLETNGVPKNRWGQPTWHEIEVKGYSLIIPKRSIMIKVEEFVKKYDICNSSSMHIRATDLAKRLAASRKHLNIGSYENFVRYQQDNKAVFLMTDSPEVQSNFINQFGASKVLTYHKIPGLNDQFKVSDYKKDPALYNSPEFGKKDASNISSVDSDMKHITVQAAIGSVLPEDHRFTTLEHTLIDVLIAAHSREFKPALFSSLSDLVRTYSWIGKKKWGWCPHINHRPHMIIK